jgi:pentatricopeptide repeat protein
VTYTSLVNMLMIEGDAEAARRVVERDMPAAGVQPNKFTEKALAKPEKVLRKMRVRKLGQWLLRGSSAGTEAAWDLTDALRARGLADTALVNAMLGEACYSSEEQMLLVDAMPEEGLAPDVVTFNALVDMLMVEGDAGAAQTLAERDMPAAGVQPNARTKRALARPESALRRMRVDKLGRWVREGGEGARAARVLLGVLEQRGLADADLRSMVLEGDGG